MTKLEKIFAAIITLSLILKFNLLPYGGILLLLSLSALAFYYFLFGKAIFNGIRLKKALRKDSYKEIRDSIIAISKAAGLGLSVICMGILFKLNHWAYSSVIFIAGLSTTFLVTIIAYRGWKKYKNKTYRRIVGRTATIGLIGLIIAIIPELVTTKKESRYYKDQINHSIFQYKLLDGKLVDTLKVFNEYKDLVLFQEWENGRLKKHSLLMNLA